MNAKKVISARPGRIRVYVPLEFLDDRGFKKTDRRERIIYVHEMFTKLGELYKN